MYVYIYFFSPNNCRQKADKHGKYEKSEVANKSLELDVCPAPCDWTPFERMSFHQAYSYITQNCPYPSLENHVHVKVEAIFLGWFPCHFLTPEICGFQVSFQVIYVAVFLCSEEYLEILAWQPAAIETCHDLP